MTAYSHFETIRAELYEQLESALHNVSFTAHLMEMGGSITDYENALDRAASIRQKIGENHDAEMRQRSIDASVNVTRPAPKSEPVQPDMAAIRAAHDRQALEG